MMKFIFGVIFFISSFKVLEWNENRTVARENFLEFSSKNVTLVANNEVKPENEKKLVYIYGDLLSKENGITDTTFMIGGNWLRLMRNVEMYQWRESKREVNNQSKFFYSQEWSPEILYIFGDDKYKNPLSIPYGNETITASNVYLNSFLISNDFLNKLNGFSSYQLTQYDYDRLPADLKSKFKLYNNYLLSGDINNPKVGDVRISFSKIDFGPYSFVGLQTGNMLSTYFFKDSSLALVQPGVVSYNKMFADEEYDNYFLANCMRGVGFLMMWAGLVMIFSIFTDTLRVIPFLGYIITSGVNSILFFISLMLTFIKIGLVWISVKPLTSYGMFFIGFCALLGFLIRLYLHHVKFCKDGLNSPANPASQAVAIANSDPNQCDKLVANKENIWVVLIRLIRNLSFRLSSKGPSINPNAESIKNVSKWSSSANNSSSISSSSLTKK